MVSTVVNGAGPSVPGSGNTSAGRTNGTGAKSSVDFGSIMSSSLATKANAKDSSLYTNVALQQNKSASVDTEVKNKPSVDDNAGDKADGKTGYVSDKINADGKTEEPSCDTDKLDAMLEEVRQKIKDVLGVSDEQLEAAMAALGMTMQDLLKANNLTELVAQLTGSEGVMTLLTDSDLSAQLKEIMNFISEETQQLADSMDMTPEELTQFITQPKTENAFEEVSAQVKQQTLNADEQPDNDKQPRMSAGNTDSPVTVQDVIASKLVTADEGTADMGNRGEQQAAFGKDADAPDISSAANVTANLANSIEEAFQDVLMQDVQPVDAADVVRQIVDSVKVVSANELQSMEIQLNPENLGKLHVAVTSRNGVLTAQITAQDEAVKRAIESQLAQLKDNFNNQGIKVENVEVTVSSHAFGNNPDMAGESEQNANTNARRNKRLNLDSLMGLSDDELTDDEQHVMDLLGGQGSSVSYTA